MRLSSTLFLCVGLLVACTGGGDDTGETADTDTDTGTDTDTDTDSDTTSGDSVLRNYDVDCENQQFGATAPNGSEDGQWMAVRLAPPGAGSVDAVRVYVLHQPAGDDTCDAQGSFEMVVWTGGENPPSGAPSSPVTESFGDATPSADCHGDTCRLLEADLGSSPLQVGASDYVWVAVQAYYVTDLDGDADVDRSCFAKCDGPASTAENKWIANSGGSSAWTSSDWSSLSSTVYWAEADFSAQ